MDEFLTFTVTGLTVAGVFAIAAGGLVLTYTTTGIFNFAHGAIGMLGAFSYWQLLDWGVPAGVAVAAVLLVAAPGLGVVIDLLVMRRVEDAPATVRAVVSIGLLAAALGLGLWVWPPNRGRPVDRFFEGSDVDVLGVRVTWHELLALLLAIALAGGLAAFLRRSRAGIAMRATVDDRPLARLFGARPGRSTRLAWSLGCSLAALAGMLLAPLQTLSHLPLTLLIVNAYAAAMIGRLRSLPWTFAGALVLGLLDAYGAGYLPSDRVLLAGFRPAIPVVVLFVVLVALPSARLRTRGTGRQREEAHRPGWTGAAITAAGLVGGAAFLAAELSEADALDVARGVGLAIIALSLVPLVGWAGQLSLCQMSFAAIGALTMAHLGHHGALVALGAGATIAAGVGALVALPALRLHGIELALATAAFAVILDRWIFDLPSVALGPIDLSFFDRSTVSVSRPGGLSNTTWMVVLVAVLATAHLCVVAVRRSALADRLLALKDSPAAYATLGFNPVLTRLAVFSASAALAAVGGGLHGATLGTVGKTTFDLFQSLPLLLVTVAGGIATTGGALFAGTVLGGTPVIAAAFPGLAGLLGVLPGALGITLGRNPDGVARDLTRRLTPLASAGGVLPLALGAAGAGLAGAWASGFLSGWWALLLGFVLPFAAADLLVRTRASEAHPLDGIEQAGVTRPWTEDDVRHLDAALSVGGCR